MIDDQGAAAAGADIRPTSGGANDDGSRIILAATHQPSHDIDDVLASRPSAKGENFSGRARAVKRGTTRRASYRLPSRRTGLDVLRFTGWRLSRCSRGRWLSQLSNRRSLYQLCNRRSLYQLCNRRRLPQLSWGSQWIDDRIELPPGCPATKTSPKSRQSSIYNRRYHDKRSQARAPYKPLRGSADSGRRSIRVAEPRPKPLVTTLTSRPCDQAFISRSLHNTPIFRKARCSPNASFVFPVGAFDPDRAGIRFDPTGTSLSGGFRRTRSSRKSYHRETSETHWPW